MAFSANGMIIIASWKIGKGRKQEDNRNEKKVIKNRKAGGEKEIGKGRRKRRKRGRRRALNVLSTYPLLLFLHAYKSQILQILFHVGSNPRWQFTRYRIESRKFKHTLIYFFSPPPSLSPHPFSSSFLYFFLFLLSFPSFLSPPSFPLLFFPFFLSFIPHTLMFPFNRYFQNEIQSKQKDAIHFYIEKASLKTI